MTVKGPSVGSSTACDNPSRALVTGIHGEAHADLPSGTVTFLFTDIEGST